MGHAPITVLKTTEYCTLYVEFSHFVWTSLHVVIHSFL